MTELTTCSICFPSDNSDRNISNRLKCIHCVSVCWHCNLRTRYIRSTCSSCIHLFLYTIVQISMVVTDHSELLLSESLREIMIFLSFIFQVLWTLETKFASCFFYSHIQVIKHNSWIMIRIHRIIYPFLFSDFKKTADLDDMLLIVICFQKSFALFDYQDHYSSRF